MNMEEHEHIQKEAKSRNWGGSYGRADVMEWDGSHQYFLGLFYIRTRSIFP